MLVFPAVLIPLSTRLELSLVETLSLSFWMYLLFGVSALPWGMLADKISARLLLMIFYIGAGGAGLLAAVSLGNPKLLGFALTGIGLFSGIYHPVGLGWIARDIENTSLAMGYNGMFGNLGLAVAPLAAGLINYSIGLEAVYLCVGLLNLSGVVLLLKAKNNRSKKSIEANSRYQQNSSLLPFIILLFAMMLGGIVYRGTSVTLPAYFQLSNAQLFEGIKHLFGGIGTENVVATILTSAIYFFGMAGQFFGGKIGEQYELRRSYCLFHIITVPAALAMAMTSNIPLIGFAMVHSFFLLGMQPIENTLVSRLAPPGLMSSAYGLKFILTFGVGALSV
ncbi:MAG: MFS transporter, partial [Desulfocapsaceae bacterium]|nr:MFS transporter [Desulfocapsaceae bacterium]